MNRRYGVAAVAFALVATGVLAIVLGWAPFAAWLAGWSMATFAAYGVDKAQAIRGGRRIPERTLHGLALGGGAIGGWAGMLVFRHKIRKPFFALVLATASALEVAVWIAVVR